MSYDDLRHETAEDDDLRDKYADEIAEERDMRRRDRERAMDYADRSGAHLCR